MPGSGATQFSQTSQALNYQGRCEACGRDLFFKDGATAYRVRNNHKVEHVDLQGKQPWQGIRLICVPCMLFFWRTVAESVIKGEA
jgi:hypothetical protein